MCDIPTQTTLTWNKDTCTFVEVERSSQKDITAHTPSSLSTSTVRTNIVWFGFDGASRGNPGLSGCGAYASIASSQTPAKKKTFMSMSKWIPSTTNNMAEWQALVYGLRELCNTLDKHAIPWTTIDLRMKGDSRLVVEQLCGRWKIKDQKFRQWYTDAHSILSGFGKWDIVHVYREQNTIADQLANRAIDTTKLNISYS